MSLRIAYARINQESNALSPILTTLADFKETIFMEGETLAAAVIKGGDEAPGFMKNAELSGFIKSALADGDVETLPILSAWAVPSGPLTRDTFEDLSARLLNGLRDAMPLDGVLLTLHGAMCVDDLLDPEGVLLTRVRELIGPDVRLVTTYDLHGNLSTAKVDAVDALCAYRTNPHRDHCKVGQRAGKILIDMLRDVIVPTQAWRSLPMVMGGGSTVDFLPTMRPLFKRMKQMEKNPKVLYCSLFTCHLWNDHPHLGWSTHVVTDNDPGLAEELAEELAELCWSVRNVPAPHFPSVEEAIAKVRKARIRRKLGTICFSDASDVVPAGGTGENHRIIAALQREGQGLLAYVPFRDPAAVAELWDTPEGAPVSFELGGKLHPEQNDPLHIEGTLLGKFDVKCLLKHVVVASGDIRLVITSGPPIAMKPAFYKDVGLDPMKADLVVVKSFFPFLIYFLPYSRTNIFVRTEGITDFDAITKLTFADPVHPIDEVAAWRPTDRKRRGVG